MKTRVKELRAIVAKTHEEVSVLARGLRPSILDDLGLVAALERYVKGYEAATGLRIDFYADGLRRRRPPPELETALYRIVQEALTNVVKHAQARNVSVLLERRGLVVPLLWGGAGPLCPPERALDPRSVTLQGFSPHDFSNLSPQGVRRNPTFPDG